SVLLNPSYLLIYKRNGILTLVVIIVVIVRKMISHIHKYCNMFVDDDPLLRGSIDDIKNADRYEEADKKKMMISIQMYQTERKTELHKMMNQRSVHMIREGKLGNFFPPASAQNFLAFLPFSLKICFYEQLTI